MDPVIVSVTDGDEFPIGLVITNNPGSLVDVSVTEPATTPIDVTVTQPTVNVIDVTVTENAVGPVEVAVTDGTPNAVQVSVTEIVPAPIEVDVTVLSGKQGPPGEAPFGVALPFFGANAPTNFAFPIGQTLLRATYPDLATEIAPDASSPFWVDATDFLLPDLRNQMLAGLGPETWSDTLNKSGGSPHAIVANHVHEVDPPNTATTTDGHTHSVNPPSTTTSTDTHSHTFPAYRTSGSQSPLGTGYAWYRAGANTSTSSDSHSHTINIGAFNTDTDTHGHSVDIPAFDSGDANNGVSGADKNLPPYTTCNFIMRLL